MYGRQIRGPLELIKQRFLNETQEQDIPSRLLDMSANILTWMADARMKKVQNQVKMKKNLWQKAKDRNFLVGDNVLVFLPEGKGKLDSKWKGLYSLDNNWQSGRCHFMKSTCLTKWNPKDYYMLTWSRGRGSAGSKISGVPWDPWACRKYKNEGSHTNVGGPIKLSNTVQC